MNNNRQTYDTYQCLQSKNIHSTAAILPAITNVIPRRCNVVTIVQGSNRHICGRLLVSEALLGFYTGVNGLSGPWLRP